MFAVSLGEGAELRPLEPWQAEEFAAHADRVRDEILPWIPWATKVKDVATAREFMQAYADKQAADSGRLYGIWLDGELVGGTLFRVFNAAIGVCEVGVWLGSPARGRGLITNAVQHMIDWAVRERGLARVEWLCDPENANSRKAATRIGFTHEATHRSAFVLDGDRRDVEVWAILADEWPAR